MGDSALKRLQIGLEGGYTSGVGSVYNGGSPVAATRRLAVEKGVTSDFHFSWERPEEARGSYAGNYTSTLHQIDATGKFNAAVYADDLIYTLRMVISGAPTVTTIPVSPSVLLAATAISASMSLTTQPNALADAALGKIIAATLSNASPSTASVTMTFTGTAVNGSSLSEVVAFTLGTTTPSAVGGGSGALSVTLYTKNYFATVTAVTTSAQPASDQVALAGLNAFLWYFPSDMGVSTLLSATTEYFDGTASWQLPGTVLEKGTFSAQIGKAFKFESSFLAQKKAPLPATATSINPSALAGQQNALTNLADSVLAAIATYSTRFYADPQGTIPGTTQINARLTELKFDIDMKAKLGKAADGTPYPSFVARAYYGPSVMGELTLLFNNYAGTTVDPIELTNFMTGASRTVRGAWPGPALPTGILTASGGFPAWAQDVNSHGGYYGIAVDMSGKYESAAEKEVEGRAAFTYKLVSEVDVGNMGVPLACSVISRINPNQ